MTYIIYKDGVEENRIVADEAFCKQYYNSNGYSYKLQPPPEPPKEEEVSEEEKTEE